MSAIAVRTIHVGEAKEIGTLLYGAQLDVGKSPLKVSIIQETANMKPVSAKTSDFSRKFSGNLSPDILPELVMK